MIKENGDDGIRFVNNDEMEDVNFERRKKVDL
jgi:hypothetical protein